MTLFLGQAGSLRRRYASQVAGLAAMTIGAAALIGPWAGLSLLSSWGSSFGTVKPVTAMCLAALGLALVPPGKGSRFALAVGLVVAAVALLDLFGVDLGINRWLAPRTMVPGPVATSFQMINGMPLAIALAGGSLTLSRFEGHHFAATALGGLASVMAVFALLAYLTGIHIRYGGLKPPALPTAMGVLCVAGAILLQVGMTSALREPRPLWHLLIMLGCAIVAPLLLFGAYAGARVTDEHLSHVRNDLMSEARTISAEVDHEVFGEIERLQALAASPALREGDFAEFQRQAEASLPVRQRGDIILVDRNMQQLVNTGVPFGTPLPKTVIAEAMVAEPIERALATGTAQITDLFMAPLVKRFLFVIMVPVQIDGENRYVLARSADRRALEYPVAEHELPPGWLAVVSDTARRIIARSQQEDAFIGQELPLAQWHPAERGDILEFIDSQGQPSLQGHVWSELTGWETAVWAPAAALEAPVRALWLTIGVMAWLAFALVVALAWGLGRIITRSVGHAARAAIALGEGRPMQLLGTSIAEVDTLIAELRRTAAKRQTAEHLLRESEITFRQLVDNSPFGIFSVDADFRLMQLSAGAQRAFKSVQPLIGNDMAEATRFLWTEPFASDAIGRFRHTLDTGEPYHAPCSVQQRKDTGAVETYDWRIERVTMPDGRFVVVCHFYDLTERQKYEAALRESEATFRAMFDVSSVGKIEVDPKTGRFLRANAAMCEFVGYSEAELLPRTVYDITHPDDRNLDSESLRCLVAGQSSGFNMEKRYIRKDGNAVWARVTVNTVRDEYGKPLRNIGVILDLNARKQAEQDLQASKDRLQIALDAAQFGWWQYDPRHRVFSGDTRSKEIFEFAKNEAALEEIIKVIHPDDVERVLAALEARLDPVDPNRTAIEFRLRRGHGEVRWVESLGLAYFEGVGREQRAVSVVGTVADITERKQRELERREREEKVHLLMREVNHRAKNMLSVVQAIARQTATKNPEDFIERFSERIQALSASQDLLVRNEWNGVEIEDLVRAQLAHLSDLVGSRIAVHGPKLRLKAASAQAIGLVVHELATNAGKYGALSIDTGRVVVCWATDGDTFTMSWIERDGPPVFVPKRHGFGTMVMEAMVEHSVDGTVDLDYAPSGLTWRLTCLTTNALEPG
jgi:PAS domain S-box-containing protein